jgi:hypothetical protein
MAWYRDSFTFYIVSVILSNRCTCTCVLFRTVFEIELLHRTDPKLLIRKRYYVLFLIPIFIVQVTKVGTVYLIPPSTSMHFATHVRTNRDARLYSVEYSVQYNNLISETVQNTTHTNICFRMIDTRTSMNN